MSERLDYIERILVGVAERQSDTEAKLNAFITAVHEFEDLVVDDHKRLLTAQVIISEKIEKLFEAQKQTDEKLSALIDAQKHGDDRLSALIDTQKHGDERLNALIVDGIVRHRPPNREPK